MKIAVIGSGPTGLSTLAALSEFEYEITLYDPLIEVEELENFEGANQVISSLKSHFGKTGMYSYPNDLIENFQGYPIHLSGVIGGLSTVWGAGLDMDSESLNSKFSASSLDFGARVARSILPSRDEHRTIGKRFNVLIQDTHKRTHKVKVVPSNLAIDWSKCTYCGSCLTGCPTGAIWNAADQVKSRILSGLRTEKGFVERIQTTNSGQVGLLIRGQSEFQIYDKCFVACGPIATVGLLQRSGVFPEKVILNETNIVYTPFFAPNRTKEPGLNFSASQAFLVKPGSKKNGKVWVSLFELSAEVKEKAKKYLYGLESLLPKNFLAQFLVGIHYLPQSLSGNIWVSYDGFKSRVSPSRPGYKSKFKTLFYLIRFLSEITFKRIYPIPFFSRLGEVGGSYHLGVVRNVEGDFLLDKVGQPQSVPNLHVVDSSSLLYLEPGPITALVMINAAATVHTVLIPNESLR